MSSSPRVVNKVSLLELSLVNPHVGELAVLSLLQLERQSHEGVGVGPLRVEFDRDLVLLSGHFVDFTFAGVDSQVGHLRRVGQIVNHRVQKRLDTFVLQSSAHHDRCECPSDGRSPDSLANLRLVRSFFFQEHLADEVIRVCQMLNQFVTVLGPLCPEVCRDFVVTNRLAKVAVKVDGSVGDDVDQTFEV